MDVDVIFLPDGTVNLVVPKGQPVSFETAAPKLLAFAESLSAELGLPVKVVPGQGPERHAHDAQGQHVGIQRYVRQ